MNEYISIRDGIEVELDLSEIEELELSRQAIRDYEASILNNKSKLYKSTFIRRMSIAEAASMYEILEAEEPWMKLLYNATDYFLVSDALIGYLHLILAEEFGEDRADELLTPEE